MEITYAGSTSTATECMLGQSWGEGLDSGYVVSCHLDSIKIRLKHPCSQHIS